MCELSGVARRLELLPRLLCAQGSACRRSRPPPAAAGLAFYTSPAGVEGPFCAPCFAKWVDNASPDVSQRVRAAEAWVAAGTGAPLGKSDGGGGSARGGGASGTAAEHEVEAEQRATTVQDFMDAAFPSDGV